MAVKNNVLPLPAHCSDSPISLFFDEAASNLDQHTAEQFAQTINKLKGKVTILFITHQLPKGLAVDDAILLGKDAEETNKQQQQEMNQDKTDIEVHQKE